MDALGVEVEFSASVPPGPLEPGSHAAGRRPRWCRPPTSWHGGLGSPSVSLSCFTVLPRVLSSWDLFLKGLMSWLPIPIC